MTEPVQTIDGPGCARHRGDPHNLCPECWKLEPIVPLPHPNKRVTFTEVHRFGDAVVGIHSAAVTDGLWWTRRDALRLGLALIREALRG